MILLLLSKIKVAKLDIFSSIEFCKIITNKLWRFFNIFLGTVSSVDPNWKPSVRIVPWGFRKLINWVKNKYDNPLIYITENGLGDETGTLQDDERILYLKVSVLSFTSQMFDVIYKTQLFEMWCGKVMYQIQIVSLLLEVKQNLEFNTWQKYRITQ